MRLERDQHKPPVGVVLLVVPLRCGVGLTGGDGVVNALDMFDALLSANTGTTFAALLQALPAIARRTRMNRSFPECACKAMLATHLKDKAMDKSEKADLSEEPFEVFESTRGWSRH